MDLRAGRRAKPEGEQARIEDSQTFRRDRGEGGERERHQTHLSIPGVYSGKSPPLSRLPPPRHPLPSPHPRSHKANPTPPTPGTHHPTVHQHPPTPTPTPTLHHRTNKYEMVYFFVHFCSSTLSNQTASAKSIAALPAGYHQHPVAPDQSIPFNTFASWQ